MTGNQIFYWNKTKNYNTIVDKQKTTRRIVEIKKQKKLYYYNYCLNKATTLKIYTKGLRFGEAPKVVKKY